MPEDQGGKVLEVQEDREEALEVRKQSGKLKELEVQADREQEEVTDRKLVIREQDVQLEVWQEEVMEL